MNEAVLLPVHIADGESRFEDSMVYPFDFEPAKCRKPLEIIFFQKRKPFVRHESPLSKDTRQMIHLSVPSESVRPRRP
jgi:hypothetical protein